MQRMRNFVRNENFDSQLARISLDRNPNHKAIALLKCVTTRTFATNKKDNFRVIKCN